MSKGEVKNPEEDGRVNNPEEYKSEKSKEAEIQQLEDLFKHLIQDMLFAENKIADTLPKMAQKASNADLKSGFENHLKETHEQIDKLKQVCDLLGYEKKREKCEAIIGLLEEGDGLMKETASGSILDAAMIAAAQKVEHYEIASYGTLCSMAEDLGYSEAKDLLGQILDQEEKTDQKLTDLSHSINQDSVKLAA